MMDPEPAPTWRRALVSAFVLVTLVGVVVWNLPDSGVRRALAPALTGYITTVGLDQNWGVFAPNPREITLDLYARVEFEDGAEQVWRMPDSGPVLKTYRIYRWRKWMENVRLDANARELWEPTARWLVRIHEGPQRLVTRVTLVRRWQDIPPPGSDAQPEWNEFAFYSFNPRTGESTSAGDS